jgi:hypothetical protein
MLYHLLTPLQGRARRPWAAVLILSALTALDAALGRLDNGYVWLVLFVTFGFGAIGFADDLLKVTRFNTKGVPGKMRLRRRLRHRAGGGLWAAGCSPRTCRANSRCRSSRTC